MSVIAIILILFLILLFTGLPLYVNLGLTSFLYMFLTGTNPMVVVQRITQASNSFTMIAAPFFILMGNLMNTGGVTRKMFRFANVIVGTVPGGMGHANVLCSALFAGMSGTAVADAGGLGNIEIQAMREVGYDDDFSCAVTAASSVLGPIIPPSLPMVIMCVTVGASVGRCFVGGIIPGILIAIALCAMVAYYARKRGYPRNPRPTLKVIWVAFKEAFLALMAPVILFVSIYTGIVTTTEAAIVAAAYSLLIGLLSYKDLKLKDTTYSTTPMGGVTTPIIRFRIMIRQAWVSLQPIAIMAGIRMGPRIRMAAVPSMKQPMNSRNTLTRIRNSTLFWIRDRKAVICWGIWATDRM